MTESTTIKTVKASHSPRGELGQKYLIFGKTVSMRLWEAEPSRAKPPTRRHYETVGYVIHGVAELHLEGQTVRLEAGDSWLVPKGAEHKRPRSSSPLRRSKRPRRRHRCMGATRHEPGEVEGNGATRRPHARC